MADLARAASGLLVACRLHYSTSSTLPAILAGALALQSDHFSSTLFIALLASAFVAHIFVELKDELDDYIAYRRSMPSSRPKTAFSGGSGALAFRMISRPQIQVAVFVTGAIFIALSALLLFWVGPAVIIFGSIGVIWMTSYSLPTGGLSSKGFGELGVLICLGPLISLGTYCSLAIAKDSNALGWCSWHGLAIVFVPGLVQFSMIHIQEIFDVGDDRKSNKHTLVVRFGISYAWFAAEVALTTGIALLVIASLFASLWYALPLVPLSIGIVNIRSARKRKIHQDPQIFALWLRKYPLYWIHGSSCVGLFLAIIASSPPFTSSTSLTTLTTTLVICSSMTLFTFYWKRSFTRLAQQP